MFGSNERELEIKRLYEKGDNITDQEAGKIFGDYELSRISRKIPWDYTQSGILPNETVLIQGYYNCTYNGWKEIIFYIVIKDNQKYCKIFNIKELEEAALSETRRIFNNHHVSYCERSSVGKCTNNYRRVLLDTVVTIPVDNTLENIINSLKNVDFSEAYLDMVECQNLSINYDCYDFINNNVFVADGLALEKYKPYIELLNYILENAKISGIKTSEINFIKDYKEAIKISALKLINHEYSDKFRYR